VREVERFSDYDSIPAMRRARAMTASDSHMPADRSSSKTASRIRECSSAMSGDDHAERPDDSDTESQAAFPAAQIVDDRVCAW
jgi:hypothetical protein